ncbi:MGDG synthase-domain-containing protein, partial [Ostreococcus tauri]
ERLTSVSTGEKLRILCLSSDTGGGHRASAQALHDFVTSRLGDEFSFNTVDLWSNHSPWPFCNMPQSYFFLVKHPWLWRLNFRCSEPKFIHNVMFKGYAAIVARTFTQAFTDYLPQLIVSVHPLMQHVPLQVLSNMKAAARQDTSVSFSTVVTDLTRCHTTWFHPKGVDRCFVANDVVARQAREQGLESQQIACHGLPIRPAFRSVGLRSDKSVLRLQLGLDPHASTVMLIGGGEGMGKIAAITEALSRRLSTSDQLIVVCGRNTTLASELARQNWDIQVVVKGFINNMADYMACCDCVITKAGPGTIAEALTCGLPIVLNGCIPCQEEGNIPYVLQNEVGAYSEEPEKIAEVVSQWFGPLKDRLHSMSARARSLGRPEATFDIVRELADMTRKAAMLNC